MATAVQTTGKRTPLMLICGDDDFSVKQRARSVYDTWCREAGGMDHETIDAAVQNSGDALKALGRLRSALDTLPFLGSEKVVWFKDCSFLGEDRTSSSGSVTEALGSLAEALKTFRWDGVRLVISAGKPDKRRALFKTLEKLGSVELFQALSPEDRDWTTTAENHAVKLLRSAGKEADDDALAELVNRVGPHLRALASEVEKLCLYVGERARVGREDVERIVTRQKQAKAFALAEALGERDLRKLLKTLDEELWEMRVDRRKSEIGLLYGLVTKVRALLFLKELRDGGRLKPARDYAGFKLQLERLSTEELPADKRYNPLALHPFTLFQAFRQTENYRMEELVDAMAVLLECNRDLVSSDQDEALVLQRALVRIVGFRKTLAGAAGPAFAQTRSL